ncbi:TrmB family transcriptional regulator [Nanoarchaeota archaeon]
MPIDLNEEVLREQGLTDSEIKVYLALLQTTSTTVGSIVKATGLYKPNVYDALDKLMVKGLASYNVIANRKYFRASPPERFLTMIAEKRRAVEEIMPQLKELSKFSERQQGATTFMGSRGIITALENMLTEISNNGHYDVFASGLFKPVLRHYYKRYQLRKKELNITTSCLYDKAMEEKKDILDISFLDAKFYPMEFAAPTDTFIFNDKVLLVVWQGRPTFAVLIQSKDLADSYRAYFKRLWAEAGAEYHYEVKE